MIKKVLKFKKINAQAVVEGCIAFVLTFLIFIFIMEFALYFQNMYANQTFSDDINANISSFDRESFCTKPDDEALELIESRAKKYLDNKLELSIDKQNEDILVLKSKENFLNKNILTVKIVCSNLNTGYIVKSEYLYRGFFVFRTGHMLSGISSVQTLGF